MPAAKRSGTSLCISAATSPCRPCVLTTRARVMKSPLDSGLKVLALLLDDFECVALAGSVACGAQQCTQSASAAALASDDLAHVAFGDFQFDDVVIEHLDENFIGSVDQRFRDQLNEYAHISRGLSHNLHSHCGNETIERSSNRRRQVPQRLKPLAVSPLMARLKSCPSPDCAYRVTS